MHSYDPHGRLHKATEHDAVLWNIGILCLLILVCAVVCVALMVFS